MIRTSLVSVGMMISTVSTPAHADSLIFACQTKSGKVVRLSELGSNVRYSYGRDGYPDLVFIEHRHSVEKACRNDPNGGFFYHGMSIKHDGLTYTASKNESVDPSRKFMTISLVYLVSVSNAGGQTLSKIPCIRGIVDNIRSAKVPDAGIGDCE